MAKNKSADFIFVGYDSPKLVSIARIFTRKKIIYNALCSVYERLIVSRNLAPKFSLRACYYWLLDFFAVNSANLVMLESDGQINYFKDLFFAPEKKLIRAWTGVDENNFFYDPSLKKFDKFTVIFRGALMPESGAEFVIRAAKLLEGEDINFIMQSGGLELKKIKKTVEDLNPKNLKLKYDFISNEELRVLMQKCHLSLGQLSDHDRLKRTIPHKCYEALALRLPYLTASNNGVMELLIPEKTCLVCKSADEKSLARAILWAKDHPAEIEAIAQSGYDFYQENLKPTILAANLLSRIKLL